MLDAKMHDHGEASGYIDASIRRDNSEVVSTASDSVTN